MKNATRKIERTQSFKADYRRIARGLHSKVLKNEFREIVESLATDIPLKNKFRDHALKGKWRAYRECHVKPDLLLIYRLIGSDRLILVRLGSHSELKL